MALKPDRDILQYDVSHFIPAITYGGERGGVVVATGAAPSGAAMDQSVNGVWYAAATGGNPMGVLLQDAVNIDLNRQPLNPHKSEVQVGDKVTLCVKGWVVTNKVDLTGSPGGAITAGKNAYMGPSGTITTGSDGPLVGKFLSAADEDGYVKVQIDL